MAVAGTARGLFTAGSAPHYQPKQARAFQNGSGPVLPRRLPGVGQAPHPQPTAGPYPGHHERGVAAREHHAELGGRTTRDFALPPRALTRKRWTGGRHPGGVGLPGRRREEVAHAAGVSVTLRRLERAGNHTPERGADAIARALRLDDAERGIMCPSPDPRTSNSRRRRKKSGAPGLYQVWMPARHPRPDHRPPSRTAGRSRMARPAHPTSWLPHHEATWPVVFSILRARCYDDWAAAAQA